MKTDAKIIDRLKKMANTNSDAIFNGVAIIAGNPCFKLVDGVNKFKIARQLTAFEAGLKAYKIFSHYTDNITITILVDHKESIKKFLKDGSKNKDQKANANGQNVIKFTDLIEKIRRLYEPTLEKYSINPDIINILFEKQCINRFRQWLKRPDNVKHLNIEEKFEFEMFREKACKEKIDNSITDFSFRNIDNICAVNLNHEIANDSRLTCRCIFAYLFKKVNEYSRLENQKGLIIGIWGEDPIRCDTSVIKGGEDIVKKYFKEVTSNITPIFNVKPGKDDIIEVSL